MLLAVDTYYGQNACTIGLLFENWRSSQPLRVICDCVENPREEYVPGQFYKKELPCILRVLQQLSDQERTALDAIIVDGFVYLDDQKRPGLGRRLYDTLEYKIPVVGVAKTNFASIDELKVPVLRGESSKPLYVTSVGIPLSEAASAVQSMDGIYRMPTLLKLVDHYSRYPQDI